MVFSKSKAERFFARLQNAMGEPKTELVYVNTFTLLVAVVLSAQATDKGVNKATAPLFKIADTPAKMAALGEAGLTDYIKTIGLYRNKAKNVIALSKILLERHGGQVPADRAALEELPGVGRKTANVVLNVAFGEKTIAVDTHIFRVANRTGSGTRQDAARSGRRVDACRTRCLSAACPSLAYSAWTLCLHGARAQMSGLRRARSLRLSGQDRRGVDAQDAGERPRKTARQLGSAAISAPRGTVST